MLNWGRLTIVAKKPDYGRVCRANTHEEEMCVLTRSMITVSHITTFMKSLNYLLDVVLPKICCKFSCH